jgi:hypothetical protein
MDVPYDSPLPVHRARDNQELTNDSPPPVELLRKVSRHLVPASFVRSAAPAPTRAPAATATAGMDMSLAYEPCDWGIVTFPFEAADAQRFNLPVPTAPQQRITPSVFASVVHTLVQVSKASVGDAARNLEVAYIDTACLCGLRNRVHTPILRVLPLGAPQALAGEAPHAASLDTPDAEDAALASEIANALHVADDPAVDKTGVDELLASLPVSVCNQPFVVAVARLHAVRAWERYLGVYLRPAGTDADTPTLDSVNTHWAVWQVLQPLLSAVYRQYLCQVFDGAALALTALKSWPGALGDGLTARDIVSELQQDPFADIVAPTLTTPLPEALQHVTNMLLLFAAAVQKVAAASRLQYNRQPVADTGVRGAGHIAKRRRRTSSRHVHFADQVSVTDLATLSVAPGSPPPLVYYLKVRSG